MTANKGVSIFLLVLGTLSGVSSLLCDDLSHEGCTAFAAVKPDLCQDPALASNCKRFCNLCPVECYHCPSPVRDPNMCTVTQPCGVNQTCILSELLATDGHQEYIMSCGNKGICDGFPFGFGGTNLIGRRDIDLADALPGVKIDEVTQSDVSFRCCHTDNCNKDQLLATTPPQTPPQTTSRGFQGCGKDIAIALDTSGSIGPPNFKHMLDFVSQIISIIEIGPQHSQISVDTFSSRSKVYWWLNTYVTRDQMLQALSQVLFTSGTTHTDLALVHLTQGVFTAQNGDRPNAENVVLVVTDGHSSYPQKTKDAAKQLHNESTNIVAVGIGPSVDHNELATIATDTNHMIDITDFNMLPSIVSRVVSLLCA